jgi:hypothetical protein
LYVLIPGVIAHGSIKIKEKMRMISKYSLPVFTANSSCAEEVCGYRKSRPDMGILKNQ